MFDHNLELLNFDNLADSDGYFGEDNNTTPVMAQLVSITRAPASDGDKFVPRNTIVFRINAEEYEGQTTVRYSGKEYEVVRAYTPEDSYLMELKCQEVTR